MTAPPLPLTYDLQPPHIAPASGTKSPLLLLLHGVGSNEQDLAGLVAFLDGRFTVASVRGPNTLGPGAYAWYPVEWTDKGPIGDTDRARTSRDRIVEFIQEATTALDTDPARVYLMGFSQGAIMSLYVALTRPEIIAGAVLMSGRLLPEAWAERAPDEALDGLPLLAVHGTRDRVLPLANGQEIRDALVPLPVALTYHEFDMAHEVAAESLAVIQSWLTDQLG